MKKTWTPIWLPAFLVHTVDSLPKNPLTGESRSAFNLYPPGIWIKKTTPPEVIEQEKVEFYLSGLTVTLAVTGVALMLVSLWYMVLALPVLLYPGAYYLRYPYSHLVRRIELWSRCYEGEAWFYSAVGYTEDSIAGWARREARGMAASKFYGLHMTEGEVADRLSKRLLRRVSKQNGFDQGVQLANHLEYRKAYGL